MVRTPLLRAPLLDQLAGRRVWVKAESLQITGSFKLRGATNALENLSGDAAAKGVLAYSSGNHAQAIAYASQCRDIPAVIVMPEDAPFAKIEAARAYGAEVVLYDRVTDSRETIGAEIAEARNLTIIPPFDHPDVIAGQGTVGLEIAEQASTLEIAQADVLVPVSGGGLAAGMAIALDHALPRRRVRPVEVVGFDRVARSIRTGEPTRNPHASGSICDALMSPFAGDLTLPILKRLGGPALSVTDDQAKSAMHAAMRYLSLVVEPGGAVALAAVLFCVEQLQHRDVIVVASGGNVDKSVFAEALSESCLSNGAITCQNHVKPR